ncbi:hypothetical protein [Paenarthrobacter nitroguajacolicus]
MTNDSESRSRRVQGASNARRPLDWRQLVQDWIVGVLGAAAVVGSIYASLENHGW